MPRDNDAEFRDCLTCGQGFNDADGALCDACEDDLKHVKRAYGTVNPQAFLEAARAALRVVDAISAAIRATGLVAQVVVPVPDGCTTLELYAAILERDASAAAVH